MKYGIAVSNFGKFASRENMLELGQTAETLGFDSLWVSDHIVVPKDHKGFGNVFYDPLITLSYLASKTEKNKTWDKCFSPSLQKSGCSCKTVVHT